MSVTICVPRGLQAQQVNDRRRMLVEVGTGVSRPAVPQNPIATSNRGPWSGFFLEQLPYVGALELVDVAAPEATVIVNLAARKACEWKDSAGGRKLLFGSGQIQLLPAMHPFTMRSDHGGDLLSVSIEPQFLRCAAHDLCRRPTRLELDHKAPLDDPLLREIVFALKCEIDAGFPGGSVYGESLGAAMAHHLIGRYSNLKLAAGSPYESQRVRPQIRRAVSYIHEHFSNDIALATLANEAGLSLFHFARLFKEHTGWTPHQYIIQRRLERARELLLSSHQTASEIASAVGFCDQSHLTTHFKKVFGLTPRKFRQQQSRLHPAPVST